ncbi:MAG: DUF1570 domain-containing protein [Phycisphaerae bacterium]|nr:DUF1570 domain-containing protein [Phycisphaerae bacterium]
MHPMRLTLALAFTAMLVAATPRDPDARPVKQYQTRHYVIYSDLDKDAIREADARLTALYDEYSQRTAGFASANPNERLPFYLYRRAEDYYANGGPAGSGGVFTNNKLMAFANPFDLNATWETVQHEAFHQFAVRALGVNLPIWVHEGMADYFGSSRFTGDGFVCGLIWPRQLAEIQALIQARKYMPFEKMMELKPDQWNNKIEHANYVQAWSMVHFLVHADDGKYVKPFEGFLQAVSKGAYWSRAWKPRFGNDVEAFEKRWADWWLAQPEDPTATLRARVLVATMTSFLGRAVAQRQTFTSADEFFAAAAAGKLQCGPDDWLPPVLLSRRLDAARAVGKWTLLPPSPKPPSQLRCELKDGSVLTGLFTFKSTGRIDRVTVQEKAPTSQPAK